ncbi:folate-binding protein YgfZ [Diaphorobacter sp. HDW4B]|uniref:CAF17-like 4Fe-4S cluster assembly/insertion protein YgfZ n=1 Tax=Diaphorobacter sp. HDW4B TaxID=2714925 RepID=UPI00140A56FB|nr:folate-binding protein YgfZ [Diaphorobacter sp. HDW4B]QIL72616.1 folate-binding protein YgfZ [Diaphorobacter sp. HDW4B]
MNHTASVPFDGVTPPLEHLGVIRVLGEDAASFIHGQLTQDFALQKPDQARLAAFLNAKGRMQASFIGVKRAADEILLICSRDLLPQTLKRLSMFVLRAKAKLSDASNDFVIYGLAGSAAPAGAAPWSVSAQGDASIVQLYPADGQPRALLVAPVGSPAPQGQPLSLALWQLSEVRSGVATLTQPIFEAFVPQMVNYESVGGVNFKKGCYPGQEIVARSQFRGTLKRRTYLVHVDATELAVGTEVFNASDADQPVGTVVQTAASPNGGLDALVSLQIASAEEALHAGSTSGPALQVQPLPYELLADI